MSHRYWWIGPVLQIPMQLLIWTSGNWTPRFPRAWRGRRVSIAFAGHVSKDEMAAIRRNRFELRSSPYPHSMMTFRFKDEGLTWCMGWKGRAVDALKVAVALESSR